MQNVGLRSILRDELAGTIRGTGGVHFDLVIGTRRRRRKTHNRRLQERDDLRSEHFEDVGETSHSVPFGPIPTMQGGILELFFL